ncbi:hypothetical protein NJB1507_46250 [Mycobacterium marinum]|uniref:DUF3800 domain-containing protein n=1 Tax=Mycobacterium marinum TaxID=1781 RepID=UPI0021C2FBF7|nr:DUF3800 domain-containing protein [Mycobacterium marinum]GJO33952.1 hypothetical protein NJB1507_46250 [Mycobacterium marinum]
MLLAYVDESYDRGEYWLTALAVPHHVALRLQNELDGVVREAVAKYNVPLNIELHGSPLLHAAGEWEPMKQMPRARIKIYSDAFEAIAGCDGIEIVMCGIDIARLNRRYTNPLHPHREALDMLAQALNERATETETHFMAIADEIDQSDTLRASYWDLQRLDTLSRYGGKLDRAVDALHFAPSKHSRLLQAADLVSFLHYRIRRTPVTDPRSAAASDKIWQIVQSKVTIERIGP